MKKIIYAIIYWSGLNYLYSLFVKRRLYLIMYHSISSTKNTKELCGDLYRHISIDVAEFKKQVEYLKKNGHTFISFKDLSRSDIRKVNKPTIIYFDDGFKDVKENALPILEKYNIPATLFLVTGILDQTDMLWTILYKDILTKRGVSASKQNEAIEEIKTKTDKERLEIMSQYSASEHKQLFDIFLSWEDVRYLSKKNFTMGSHGVSHRHLTECSAQEFDHEATYSKDRIGKEVGVQVEAFSFPYGRGNNLLANRLGGLGYKYVVSSGKGLNRVEGGLGTPYLRNISPKPKESMWLFALRLYFLNIRS